MQRIPIKDVKPGQIVGKDIYNNNLDILRREGKELTKSHIERLKQIGIDYIYVKTKESEDIKFPTNVSDEALFKTVKSVKKIYETIKTQNRFINHSEFFDSIDMLIEDILGKKDIVVNLDGIKSHDSYTYFHSTNVCVYSICLGKRLNYDEKKLKTLAIGTLLHDIGKKDIPKKILNKKERLNDEEFFILKQHPVNGFYKLMKFPEIPAMAKHVVYQHHENYNGNGYPRGLSGLKKANGHFNNNNVIHEFAAICRIMDSIDAATSNRPYKKPKESYEILNELKERAGKDYAPELVELTLEIIPKYPVGTNIVVTKGDFLNYRGVVTEINSKEVNKPKVRLYQDNKGKKLPRYIELDLMKKSGECLNDTVCMS